MDDLRNIRSVINVTRNNIDALNAKFANLQEPPPMYVTEYQELTSKLHELKTKEHDILEKIQPMDGGMDGCVGNLLQQRDYGRDDGSTCDRYHHHLQPHHQQHHDHHNQQAAEIQDEVHDVTDPLETESSSTTASFNSKPPKYLLRAHLPNKQRTSVQVMPGRKLRDALIKALRRRNLTCEMCEVTTVEGNEFIPWDMDISWIRAKEVQVKVIDKFPIISQISHQFIRKTFFSLAFCECCRRLLFTGFYCNQCNFRFHQRCADKVPPMCKVDMGSYCQFLLEQENCVNILSSGGTSGGAFQARSSQPRTLNQQDRSNSAPNVCINSVNKNMLTDQQKLLRQYNRADALQYSSSSQMNQEHSQSTQASPTNTLKSVKRPRARSADESNKNLLSPKTADENWVRRNYELSIV